jgi:hypothetical protein
MVTDTRLSAEVGNEASENTPDSDPTESAAQVQPTGQVARSQSWKVSFACGEGSRLYLRPCSSVQTCCNPC